MSKDVTHNQEIQVRVNGGEVVVEPPEIHGVRGFEIRLTPERARQFGHSLIRAATQAMPAPGSNRVSDIG